MIEARAAQGPIQRGCRASHRGALVLAFGVAGALALGCSRFALDDPGVDVVPPPEPLPSAHPTVGLVSAAAGLDRVRAEWRVHSGGPVTGELALFVGTERSTLFATTPVPLASTQRSASVVGLPSDQDHFVGLARRTTAADPWCPSGPILTVRTAPVIYVDPAATGSGDGSTPANAFTDLTLAVLTAFVNGGANVYVVSGEITGVSLPLFTGVHLYGGFQSAFRLTDRDPVGSPTRLVGIAGTSIADTQTGAPGIVILDGFELDGAGVATDGVFQSSEPLELRSVLVQHCGRGVRLRAEIVADAVPVVLANVTARSNALQGVSVDGAFDLVLDGCRMDSNANEGLDLNNLVALELGRSSLVVRGSRFDRNGSEGLDCHLGVPLGAGSGGGDFRVRIQDCDFEGNALEGLRVDIDYDFFPQWNADLLVRGCRARANGASGVRLDLDSRASAQVHRLRSSANAGDGLTITSETFAGHCAVSASAFLGNVGHGVRAALGNYGMTLAHCVFAGNQAGGARSEVVPAFSHSCVFDRQPEPRSGVAFLGDVETPLGSITPFLRAADEYVLVQAAAGATITVVPPAGRVAGAALELQDDAVERAGVATGGATIELAPAPDPFALPAVLALFRPPGTVEEDWRLAPGSPAAFAGLAAPGGPSVDCGPFGSATGGIPGVEADVPPALLVLGATTPSWSTGLGATDVLELEFRGGAPARASVSGSVFAFDAAGRERAVLPALVGARVHVPAPAGGWSDGDVVVVFDTLLSDEGARLASTTAIPIHVR